MRDPAAIFSPPSGPARIGSRASAWSMPLPRLSSSARHRGSPTFIRETKPGSSAWSTRTIAGRWILPPAPRRSPARARRRPSSWKIGEVGAIKLRVTRDLLRLRKEMRTFSRGETTARSRLPAASPPMSSPSLEAEGSETLLIAVQRVTASLGCPPTGPVWDDTRIEGPSSVGGWKDVITGRTHPGNQTLILRSLFSELPFAVLRAQGPE